MSFRHNVRIRVLALSEAQVVLHTPPEIPDALDRTIIRIVVQKVKSAQFNCFVIRYYPDAATPRTHKERVHQAVAAPLFSGSEDSFIRNSNRAVKRLEEVLRGSEQYRNDILKSWQNAQATAQRSLG